MNKVISGGLVVALIGLLMIGIGCFNSPVSSAPTTNASVPVDLLFEHDGCKVYRFQDGGYSRYYVRCLNTTSTISRRPAGKTSLPDEIQTEQ